MQKSQTWKILVIAALVVSGIGLWIRSQQPKAVAAVQDEGAPAKQKLRFDFEPFDLPEGDAEKLLEFSEELVEEEKEFKSAQDQHEYQVRAMLTLIAAGDKVLAQKKLSDEETEKAAHLKVQGLVNLAMMGAPDGAKNAVATVRDLAKDSRPILVQFAKNNEQIVRIICVAGLEQKDQQELITEILTELKKRKFAQRVLNRAQMLGESLESAGSRERVIEYYGQLAAAMRESEIDAVISQAIRIEGQLRRFKLPGSFLELEGTTLAGDEFDWKAYRGKVVLVDFWATWCAPCLQELPNVKENYKKFHDKGFEVVGVSLDDDPDKLQDFLKDEKISWVTLFEPEESKRGSETPLVVKYGISGIPMAILVDKEGKVISMEASGPELSRLLEQLLGEKE